MNKLSQLLFSSRLLTRTNLHTKILLAFILPLLGMLTLTSIIHAVREQQEWQEIYKADAIRYGDMVLRGLRHAMSDNDRVMIANILENIGEQDQVVRVWIVNNMGQVKFSSIESELDTEMRFFEKECVECHQYPPETRQKVTQLHLEQDVWRVAVPILNDVECQSCHDSDLTHLGVLLVDGSMVAFEEHLQEDLLINILITGITFLSIILIGYFLINWLVERRIKVVARALKSFADGNFSHRIPKQWRTQDEVTQLADSFNEMADHIEQYNHEQLELQAIRQDAILEERERISRDLHDGIVQVLAYLSKKISAVRIWIEKNEKEVALEQLGQFEKAINNEVGDVRSTIAGLRLIGQENAFLADNIRKVTEMCQQSCDFLIEIEIHEDVENLKLDANTELQLLHIIQEAISNTRKHAVASNARVTVKHERDDLVLTIEDDGQGFNPWERSLWRPPHFGLNSMSERAEKIGASFKVDSMDGHGTIITLRVKV